MGVLTLVLVKRAGHEGWMRGLAIVCALGSLALLAVSYRFFPPPEPRPRARQSTSRAGDFARRAGV